MADSNLSDVLHRMRTLGRVSALREEGDGALLAQFVAKDDEAAFEVLVQRHGPMVLGVCRRTLGDGHDAEDAFQATFLVLARRASTIRKPDAVAAWLYAVACDIAGRARKARSQRNRFHISTECDVSRSDPHATEWHELRPVLDEELGRLPEKYRAPVVLCYLEDRSNAEAAEQLGWPVGTVKGRLARARSLLQSRLAQRGVALGSGLLGLLGTVGGSQAAMGAAVPPSLGTTTVLQAMRIATGATPALAGMTPTVAILYNGGLQAMRFAKLKMFGALFALLGVFAFTGAFTFSALAGNGPGRTKESRHAPVRTDKTTTEKVDAKKPAAGTTEPAGVAIEARLVGAKESYTLDLGGKTAEEFIKQFGEGKGPRRVGTRFPPSPQVDLKLELTNTGKEEIKVQVRGNENKLTLDLKGDGAFYAPVVIQNFLPVRRPPTVLTIAPGKSVTLVDVPTLAFPKPGAGSQAYWTAPGKYKLTVDYVLGVSPAPAGTKDKGDGFGPVTVHTAPITLTVVEAKK
jgi:RNA polymerase sigma factor (sigma-70 family)